MIGAKFDKPLQADTVTKVETDSRGKPHAVETENPAPNTCKKYVEAVQWCMENHARIEDKGDYYEVVAIPAPTTEELAAQARSQRDALIAATDYLMATDYPLTDEKRQELTVYRQALRDVPEQSGFPTEIAWPVKPEWVK